MIHKKRKSLPVSDYTRKTALNILQCIFQSVCTYLNICNFRYRIVNFIILHPVLFSFNHHQYFFIFFFFFLFLLYFLIFLSRLHTQCGALFFHFVTHFLKVS